jgi:uncharacterized protein
LKIAIAGGTGFVGKALVKELVKKNHDVVILTRKLVVPNSIGQIQYVQWLGNDSTPIHQLQDTDIFINLAGESISSGRWTESRKNKILNSRIQAVRALLGIFQQLDILPQLLVNASAIGFYGTSEVDVFSEDDSRPGNDFLAKTVLHWEKEAEKANRLGIRTVFCRFGIILDKKEGALPKIALPYKAFIGGNIGDGRQWMSWIHIEDVIRGILFIIENEHIQGPVNFTAPTPVIMKDFGRTLAVVLARPHWLSVPNFALQLLMGEMSLLVVEGQKVVPKKLQKSGFQFKYPELKSSLKNIFS